MATFSDTSEAKRTCSDVEAPSSATMTALSDANPVLSDVRPAVKSVSPDARNASPAASTVADTKATPVASDPGAKFRVRDVTFGDSAKAMVDEAIWNLQPGDYEVYRSALQQGKPPEEAGRAAGGQLAVIHRKIGEYTVKLQAVLTESKRTINIEEIVDKPLEKRMLEVISNGQISESEKDFLVQQLGTIQEWVKQGLKGNISVAQANRILVAIGDRLNWGGTSMVSNEIKPIYATLYTELKTAIRETAPQAQNLQERLTNLYAAKSDLDHAISHFGMHSVA